MLYCTSIEYFSQTNIQQATILACDYLLGLGIDWEEKYRKMIKEVTKSDVQEATKYFTDKFITSTVAPSKFEIQCH